MKNIYKYSLALAFAVTIASCDDTQFEMDKPSASTGKEIRVSASLGDNTRVGVSDSGNGLKFEWQDGDYFTVLTSNQTTKFNLEEGAGTLSGEFSGQPDTEYADQEDLFAVITGDEMCDVTERDADGNLLVTIPVRQSGQLESKYQLMYSTSKYDENSETSVSFKFHHLVSVLKANLQLPDDVTSIDSIALYSISSFSNKAVLVLNEVTGGDRTFAPGSLIMTADSSRQNTIVADVASIQNGIATSYFYYLPTLYYSNGYYNENGDLVNVWSNSEAYVGPNFVAYSGDNLYCMTTETYNRNIVPGKLYEVNRQLTTPAQVGLGVTYGLPEGVYKFVPEEDGYYRFDQVEFISDMAGSNGYYQLKAGKPIYFIHHSWYYENRLNIEEARQIYMGDNDMTGLDYQYCIFVPEEDGFYTIDNVGGFLFYDAKTDIDNKYELEAGKPYLAYIGQPESTITVKKAVSPYISVGGELPEFGTYLFTPQESGYYSFYPYNEVEWLDAEYGTEQIGPHAKLEAGKTYRVNYRYRNLDTNPRLSRLPVYSTSDEITVSDLAFILQITPAQSGWYTLYGDYFDSQWFGGEEYPYNSCKYLEAGVTYEKVVYSYFPEEDHIETRYYLESFLDSEYQINETIQVDEKTVFRFTPSETGWYKVDSNDCRLRVEASDSQKYTNTNTGTSYYLLAGEEYRISILPYKDETTSFTISMLQPEKLTAELDVEYTVQSGEFKNFQFVVPEFGEYVIERLSGEWISFVRCENNHIYNYGENLWMEEGSLLEIPVDVPDSDNREVKFRVVKRQ